MNDITRRNRTTRIDGSVSIALVLWCYSMLQYVVVFYSVICRPALEVLQCVAACCSVLQRLSTTWLGRLVSMAHCEIAHTKKFMSHIRINHVQIMKDSCPTNACIMSYTRMSRTVHINASNYTHRWSMSLDRCAWNTLLYSTAHMNESIHTYIYRVRKSRRSIEICLYTMRIHVYTRT